MPKKTTIARAAPPAEGQNSLIGLFWAVVAAVVAIVSVAVCAVVPLSDTEAGDRLQVAGSLAAVGATAHVKATAPVNPLDEGVTVIVEVLLLVAPGLTVMAPLLARV